MIDISIIVACSSPSNLKRVLNYIEKQSVCGIDIEVVLILESNDGFRKFNVDTSLKLNRLIIRNQQLHSDFGAAAHDAGICESSGEYVVFWDDDNIYFEHALVALYTSAFGYDIGVVRTKHNDILIPSSNSFEAGYIDTMCLCVKKDLAVREKWSDNGGRYSDYRWLMKLMKYKPKVNFSKIVIGNHL